VSAFGAGVAAAGAQQVPVGTTSDQPAAAEPTQAPRARDADRNQGRTQEQRGTRAGQEMRKPDARVQKNMDDQQRGRAGSRETTGQSSEPAGRQRSQPQRSEGRDERRDRAGRDSIRDSQDRVTARERRTTGQSNERQSTDAPRRDDARRDDRASRGSVTLSEEQRTRISTRFSDRIERMNVRPVSRSNISVSIGATVPRSVRLHAVPNDVVTIYPRFRGHRFVVVEDEIVIIEPRSYRIVAVLPMSGERRAARAQVRETTGAAGAGARIRLSAEDRRVIRTVVMQEPACRLEERVDFFLFVPIPRTVEVCQLPQEIVTRIPAVRPYRYVVRGDDIVLVEPDGNRVVEIID
jgi:hypothetical protein